MLKLGASYPLVGFLVVSGLLYATLIERSQAGLVDGTIQRVISKLEAYALGQIDNTGLSINDLRGALEEAQSWDQSEYIKKKESDPSVSLLTDFLLVPMLRYTDPTRDGVSQEAGSTARQDYITRLEKYYKIFRPAYLGQTIDKSYHRAPKTDKLLASLIEAKDSEPLTKIMLEEAMIEYKAVSQRCSEIRAYDDVYSCARELKLIFNYLNRMEVKILGKSIFPQVPLIKTQDNIDGIRELYKSELRKLNIVVINGQMYRVA